MHTSPTNGSGKKMFQSLARLRQRQKKSRHHLAWDTSHVDGPYGCNPNPDEIRTTCRSLFCLVDVGNVAMARLCKHVVLYWVNYRQSGDQSLHNIPARKMSFLAWMHLVGGFQLSTPM